MLRRHCGTLAHVGVYTSSSWPGSRGRCSLRDAHASQAVEDEVESERERALVVGFVLARAPKDPRVGGDFAGAVEAVGPGVSSFAVGEHVFGVAHLSVDTDIAGRFSRASSQNTGARSRVVVLFW